MLETVVTQYLDEQGVKYTIKKHERPALTCGEAAEQRNVRVEQIVKCMVGRDDNGIIYIMLIPGDRTLKIKKVRRHVGGKPVHLVAPNELAGEFNLVVGAISPIHFIGKARILFDPTILQEEWIAMSSGDPLAGIELTSEDLLRITDAEQFDIVSVNRY